MEKPSSTALGPQLFGPSAPAPSEGLTSEQMSRLESLVGRGPSHRGDQRSLLKKAVSQFRSSLAEAKQAKLDEGLGEEEEVGGGAGSREQELSDIILQISR